MDIKFFRKYDALHIGWLVVGFYKHTDGSTHNTPVIETWRYTSTKVALKKVVDIMTTHVRGL